VPSYREWALDAELVLEMSFTVDDIVHVRLIDTGELCAGSIFPTGIPPADAAPA
jgi:hypothetical protein